MDKGPIRVLLVDDDKQEYLLTKDIFSFILKGEFHLDWAATYDEGLEALLRGIHDVCLIDYALGEDRDGLALIREAKSRGCAAPMILLTGYGDYDVDIRAMEAGAADYLQKGRFEPAQLERAIRYSVWRRRQASPF